MANELMSVKDLETKSIFLFLIISLCLKKNIKTLCLLMMNGNHYGGQTQKMGSSGR